MSISAQLKLFVELSHNISERVTDQSIQEMKEICGATDASVIALQMGADLIHEISHALNNGMVGLRDVLSCESFNPIYTTFVHDGEFLIFFGFLRCSSDLAFFYSINSYSVLVTSFDPAMCLQGVNGLTWIFSTTLVISIFSMVMIMFRAALFPVKEYPMASMKNNYNMEVVKYLQNSPENDKIEHEQIAEPSIT